MNDTAFIRSVVWISTYLVALHAMLPEDAPPGLITTNFSDNAKGAADEAVTNFDEFVKQQEEGK